jgi:NAD(P)-dependent dehydrogenase (short-subunit alcohol dehydrogenase family)
MPHPLDLSGRVILVTGASSGIGLATAQLLGELGAQVVLVARSRERLEAAQAQLTGGPHVIEPFDFSQPGDVAAWVKGVAAKTGPLSGVVHAAGVQLVRPVRVLAETDLEAMMKVNVNAALLLAKGLRVKGVHAPRASAVFVSSVLGLVGTAGSSAYCATKGALHSLARALALELAADDVRVNCVAPGYVRTPMLDQAAASVGPERMAALEKAHALGFGQPRDVAHAIAFLVADTGRWITGTTLTVDGGYTAS